MKTKNIFLTAISALFIFAAGTEEKIRAEPGVSGKGDLVIELAPSSVITKADPATNFGYQYATEEELTVNNCWIFAVQDNTIKARQYFSSPTQTTGPYEDKDDTYTKGYQVTLNGLNYGTYDFWVVANPTGGADDSRYTTCVTLGDLKNIIEGSTTYNDAFPNPSQLIKVGNKESGFDRANNKIIVSLTQLAAKVQLEIKVELKREQTSAYYKYYDKNWGVLSDDGLLDYNDLVEILGIPDLGPNHGGDITSDMVKGYKYFDFDIALPGKSKGFSDVTINVKKVLVYEGYALQDLNLKVNGIRVNSQIGFPSSLDYDTPNYVDNIIECGNIISYICSFYTYGKKSLDVQLVGNLLNGKFLYEQKGISSGIILNDAKSGNVNGIKEGRIIYPQTKALTFDNGWQGNTSTWSAVLITNEENLELNGDVVPVGEDVKTTPYDQTAILVPDNGFINGHYYEGTIRIQSAPVSGQMTVEIDPFKDFGPIDFGFN